ncbi:hypothetical protein OWR28_26415 [Chryseobacterium sp. 1B4]
MKAWSYLLLLFIMIASCSGNSGSQNLTWYNNATISDITEDPDKPNEMVRVAIGISAQVFYLSKNRRIIKLLWKKQPKALRKVRLII